METLERLIETLRDCCGSFPDKRRGANTHYTMADFGLAAFSLFFLQSPSFLAHQRRLEQGYGRSNVQPLFGMATLPCDNHIRDMLDPVAPTWLHPVFAALQNELERHDGLSRFRHLGSHVLIALDGTEYFCSKTLHCKRCSTRTRKSGVVEYFHAMVSATLVAPGHHTVLPLEPEFITPQDGHDKQDCETAAARRWLTAHGPRYARWQPIYLGDDLFSRQPMCEAVRAVGGHFLFVCKPSSHALIEEYLAGIAVPEVTRTAKRGRQRFTSRYRWMCGVPLRDSKDALLVNWLEIETRDAAGTVTYRNSFITDLPVDRTTVADLADCGRARWKIENETFNVLKTSGYHLEHNFGHGKDHLSTVLVSFNLLAFAFHTVCELAEELWRLARSKLGTRQAFFHNLTALTTYLIFSSWQDLLQTLAFVRPPPQPP